MLKVEKDYDCQKLNSGAGNLRKTWKVIYGRLNNDTRRCSSTGDFVKTGIVVDNTHLFVQSFNGYFINISDKLARKFLLALSHSHHI